MRLKNSGLKWSHEAEKRHAKPPPNFTTTAGRRIATRAPLTDVCVAHETTFFLC